MNEKSRRYMQIELGDDIILSVAEHTSRAKFIDLDKAPKECRFGILDEVLSAFLNTNVWRGRHYDVKTLFGMSHLDGWRYFTYEHAGVEYLATVYIFQGPKTDQLTIKLANNGFFYEVKKRDSVYRRHGGEFVLLPEAYEEFPTLEKVFGGLFRQARLLYSWKDNRMDILLTEPVQKDGKNITVTYETGFPYIDEKIPPRVLLN